MWLTDIDQALALAPEHISSYSLTIEPKTAFGKWAHQGKLKIVPDETAAQQLETLVDQLEGAGYEHYEISNFSKPGSQSLHNTSYWKQISYLGIGPSAHSYNGTSRQYNIANNNAYVKALGHAQVPYEKEILSRSDMINEFLLTSLRTSWGCDTESLISLYQYDLLTEQRIYIDNLLLQNLALLNGSALQLSKKGKLVADKIASDLFVGM
jgi:oxygen-independent coproporphyrinogen III oxidase